MAASPKFKVFNPEGEYIASTKCATLAAVMMGFLGNGASVRLGHAKRQTIYTEGASGNASESLDDAAETIWRNG